MVGLVTDRIKARGLDDRITAQQADAQDLCDFQVREPLGPCSRVALASGKLVAARKSSSHAGTYSAGCASCSQRALWQRRG